MANARDIEMKLPSLDELFSSQKERDDAKLKRIYDIPLDEIDPFPDHPFKVRDDEDMLNLVESVRVNGVLTPATVRKKEDGRYELLSGHRRFRACELAGINTLRCEVVDMTRDEGTIFMVESNFQRTTILPSEKAFAYKMRLEAMKRLPGRPGRNGGHMVHNYEGEKSRDLLGDFSGESGRTISRYIRLTELIPEILEMVDEGGGRNSAQDYTYDLDKVNALLSQGWTVKSIHPLPAYTERENFSSVAYIVLQKDE